MKKIIILLNLFFFYFSLGYSEEWKIKNKWKVSCGIVDKESLVVNGKPITKFSKKEFKLENVVFKLDKGDIGSCPTDKKPAYKYNYSGRQEISHRLPEGKTIFETDIITEGAPQYRSTVFQIHDGRNKGAPPSWIGVGMDWKIKYKFPKGECKPEKCKKIKTAYLMPGKKYRFKASIDYQKKTDGPYGPSKPYIKIGIYRIGDTGTTSFAYNNLVIKNKKK